MCLVHDMCPVHGMCPVQDIRALGRHGEAPGVSGESAHAAIGGQPGVDDQDLARILRRLEGLAAEPAQPRHGR